jgi:hypothetical protein
MVFARRAIDGKPAQGINGLAGGRSDAVEINADFCWPIQLMIPLSVGNRRNLKTSRLFTVSQGTRHLFLSDAQFGGVFADYGFLLVGAVSPIPPTVGGQFRGSRHLHFRAISQQVEQMGQSIFEMQPAAN